MCILSYIPAGVDPNETHLLNGGLRNPHGHGWAIAVDGRIHVGKSMDLVEALDGFLRASERYPHGDKLFHSRWATHGTVDTFNVHPFYMGGAAGDGQTVMAHNGILPDKPAAGDKRSDTQLFADEILSTRYRRLDRKRAFAAMEKHIGRGNKFVILTVNPIYRHRAYIANERAGVWTAGVWHSNHDYEGIPRWHWNYGQPAASGQGKSKARQWQSPRSTADVHSSAVDIRNAYEAAKRDEYQALWDDMCDLCQRGWYGSGGYCDECGSCADCYETKADCQCFLSADVRPVNEPWWANDDEYVGGKR